MTPAQASKVVGGWIDNHAGRVISGLLVTVVMTLAAGSLGMFVGLRDVQGELQRVAVALSEATQARAKTDERLRLVEQSIARIDATLDNMNKSR